MALPYICGIRWVWVEPGNLRFLKIPWEILLPGELCASCHKPPVQQHLPQWLAVPPIKKCSWLPETLKSFDPCLLAYVCIPDLECPSPSNPCPPPWDVRGFAACLPRARLTVTSPMIPMMTKREISGLRASVARSSASASVGLTVSSPAPY